MSIKTVNAQERILLAATVLFARQGIKATGVDSIVKSANTTKMSLYKYFSSKDELILAYLRQRDGEFWAWLIDQGDGTACTSKDQLLAIFDVLREWITAPDFRGCPFINASAEFPDQNHPVHQVSAAFYRKLQNHMTDLSAQSGASSPERLGGQLRTLFEGAIVSEQLQRYSNAAVDAKLAAEILIENSIK